MQLDVGSSSTPAATDVSDDCCSDIAVPICRPGRFSILFVVSWDREGKKLPHVKNTGSSKKMNEKER